MTLDEIMNTVSCVFSVPTIMTKGDDMSNTNFDVLIIGAGLSGIGAAVHLQKQCPDKRYGILEARDAIGGTWDLFRYPGVRSDSDMSTLGYGFKPWSEPDTLASGDTIRDYICEAAEEHGVRQHIQFGQRVTQANWDTSRAEWHLQVEDVATGESRCFTANFVICCSGYYDYNKGYEPEFKNREAFTGDILHPQSWPENYDYSGKRVAIIGSGATAITLLPAMAEKAEHVVMLQRSPAYVAPIPREDKISNMLRGYLPESVVYQTARTRNALLSLGFYQASRRFPDQVRKLLLTNVERRVGPDVDMKHFTPEYAPWDERLCATPDGEFFSALREGKASVVTGHIDRFTKTGIQLTNGEHVDADIVITATGLVLQMVGGMTLTVDGEPVTIPDKMVYKGCMLEDLPNFVMVIGYTNSSWTLKADLILEYAGNVLNEMTRKGALQCTPRASGHEVAGEPLMNLRAGYIQRSIGLMPKTAQAPWVAYQNYVMDTKLYKLDEVDDGVLRFSHRAPQNAMGDYRGTKKAKKGLVKRVLSSVL